MPTKTLRGNDPQTPILSAVRESQTAFIDVVRSWTDITEQLTRRLSLPVAGIDVAGALDRTFDLAEQALAAQRQFALILVGAVDRQVDTIVETVESSLASACVVSRKCCARPRTTSLSPAASAPSRRPPPRPRPPSSRRASRTTGRRPSRTGAASRSAVSRSCATGPVSWTSRAVPR